MWNRRVGTWAAVCALSVAFGACDENEDPSVQTGANNGGEGDVDGRGDVGGDDTGDDTSSDTSEGDGGDAADADATPNPCLELDCNDNIPCTTDTCDPATGCVHTVDDAVCDDGIACTSDSCDAQTGCVNAADDTACNDDVACTNDRCDAVLGCLADPDHAACDDGFDCTVDRCDGECVHIADGGACGEGELCRGGQGCVEAPACDHEGDARCDDGQACTTDRCDVEAGRCAYTNDHAACSDNTFCNGAEVCAPFDGCLPGPTPDCSDGVACTVDRCDPDTDACTNTAEPRLCDDGLFCNGVESCDAEDGCQEGTPPVCDDGQECTTDTCDLEADGCVYAPDHEVCDDGLFCTGVEECAPFAGCLVRSFPDCADDIPCTVDGCDEENDRCLSVPDDRLCSDGIFCNGVERCDVEAEGCVDSPAPTCDDENDCTSDSCDPDEDRCLNPLVDEDGDGDSPIACGGGDCDDDDEFRSSLLEEVCNGTDDDCDGDPDDGVLGECGDCDLTCRAYRVGREGSDFENGGIQEGEVTEDGSLIIGVRAEESSYLWVPNTGESTFSRWDARAIEEIGRYRVGYPELACPGVCCHSNGCNMPSRVAVDGRGDAYVANRGFAAQGSVTKIAADVSRCVDRDDSGSIETSTDNNPMDYGTDECLLWNTAVGPVNAVLRAFAIDLGDPMHPEGYPWAGGYNVNKFWKLDPDTGETLLEVDVPVRPYGGIVLSNGKMWIGTLDENATSWVDTTTGEVGPRIAYPDFRGCSQSYGITADAEERLWFSGWGCNDALGFNPRTEEWTRVDTRGYGMRTGRGITPDSRGRIWMAIGGDEQSYLGVWDANDFVAGGTIPAEQVTLLRMPPGHTGPSGVGEDRDGYMWLAHQISSQLIRIDPDTLQIESYDGPNRVYTYTDFTGSVRRTVLGRGSYTEDFEADCDNPRWTEFSWDATVPDTAQVSFVARTAATAEELDAALPIVAGSDPEDPGPVDLDQRFTDANIATGRHVRISVTLEASENRVSPELHNFSLQYFCEDD